MDQEEYRAMKEAATKQEGEGSSPAPSQAAIKQDDQGSSPDMPDLPTDDNPPVDDRGVPLESVRAELDRKLESRTNQLEQKIDQLAQMQQQFLGQFAPQQPSPPQQQAQEMPEFTTMEDYHNWATKQRKKEMEEIAAAQFDQRFNQRTQVQTTASRIYNDYQDLNNPSSALYQQFAQECQRQGIDTKNPDPVKIELAALKAAASLGILPQSTSTTPGVRAVQPPSPNSYVERINNTPAAPQPTVVLSPYQKRMGQRFNISDNDAIAQIKKDPRKYASERSE